MALAIGLGSVSYFGLFAQSDPSIDHLIDFHQYHYGAVPEEFDYDATGVHGPVLNAGRPFWRVYVDPFSPSPEFVIIQGTGLAEPDHYPIALLRDMRAKDVTLSVYLKPMGGAMDKSQGLIWRVRDKDNYYAVLANALSGKLYLLKMVNGQPHELAAVPIQMTVQFEQESPSPTWGWYTLKIETEGSRITIWFDDEKTIETVDKTFRGSGQVGLITHADSIALFDDFAVQAGDGK
jgi:hypothetical protein